MRSAVIDLGSNSIRMTVFDEENGTIRHILNEKEIIGLLGYAEEGMLSEDGILRVVETIGSFADTARAIGASGFGCFATAGLRAVKNAEEVAARVLETTGVRISVISGEEEARLDFLGAFRPEGLSGGLALDMGGGSTEIVRFCENRMENSVSLPFGSLYLYRRFVRHIMPDDKELAKIKRFVDRQLACVEWLPDSAEHAVVIGGTVRAAARLHREIYGREQEEIQGYTFEACDLKGMLRRVTEMGGAGEHLLTRIVPERVHTILPGLAAFSRIVRAAGLKTLTVSRSGVREGYLKEYLHPEA